MTKLVFWHSSALSILFRLSSGRDKTVSVHHVLTCVEPGGVLPIELELDEAEGEDDEADQRRGERREEAQPEAMVDPVVGQGAAIWWWNV